jgi:hypothetical protein
MTYPRSGVQSITIKTITVGDLKNVSRRLGPFSSSTKSIRVILIKRKMIIRVLQAEIEPGPGFICQF